MTNKVLYLFDIYGKKLNNLYVIKSINNLKRMKIFRKRYYVKKLETTFA